MVRSAIRTDLRCGCWEAVLKIVAFGVRIGGGCSMQEYTMKRSGYILKKML